MDFVDAVEVVSAVLWQLKARPYEELYAIRGAINQVENTIKEVREIKKSPTFEYDEVVKEWLKRLLALVYKMEDFPETFVLRRMLARRMGFGRSRTYIFILLQMLNLKVDIGSAMRKSKLEIDAAARATSESLTNVSRQSHVHEVSDVVGLEKHTKNMVTWLTDTAMSAIRQNLRLLLISGQTGSGKTTLAKEIFRSPEIKEHFVSRAWVSASEDLVSNFQSILKQIDSDSTVDMKSTEKELGKKLYEILQKKRCLVVVDNVKSPDLFKIIPGRSALSDDEGNGSRVLMTMTTKDKDYLVKRFVDEYPSLSYHDYELQRLHEEDAWLLFKKVSLEKDDTVDSNDFKELKGKIMAICQGIPSAIVGLARFLSTKKCYKEWLDRIGENEVSRVSTILALMNIDLTFGLRPCLLYFGLFPKDYEIPVRRLLRLWLAERFVIGQWETTGYIGNPLDAEETAVKYLKELVDRRIIEIAKRRKDGSAKTCRMPGILHDICLSKAEDIELLYILTNPDASPKVDARRVAEHGDIKNCLRKDSHMQKLRSFLSFKSQNRDTPAVEIGNFLSTEVIGRGYELLRVLDLERVYKPELPNNLGKLYQLRYLGLRWTFLDTLPPSVSQLHCLETLDVKHTNINSLPNSIWKMKYLRHLCLNEIRLDMPVKKQSISLTGLHTLWGLFVDNKTPVNDGLNRSTNLRKLGLTFCLDSVEELNMWIASLDGLESLRLRSKDKNGQPSNLELKPLSRLENLTNLYLLGKLPELHDEYFPHSIIVLTLSVSKLENDPMPILAKLPNLKFLRLLANSYTGKKIECPNNGFKSLIFLKLWMLKELETWTVGENAMQDLFELEIRRCANLKALPALNRRLCWKIVLTNMPKEFVDNARTNHYLSNVIDQVKPELEHNAPM